MIASVPASSMPPELAEFLRPRVERLGYLGEFFTHMAHQPQALLAFLRFTDEVKKPLDPRLVEVVALTVATMTGNDYERNQHERLCVALGFERDWIARVEGLQPGDAGPMSQAEAAVQELAMAMIASHGRQTAAELERVVDHVGAEDAVAVLLLVGRYLTHALIVNALELSPPVASVFTKEDADAR